MKIFVLLVLVVLFPSNAAAERVRTAIPRATLNYLSLPVEQRRIRPLYIQKAGAYLSICAAPDCVSGELIASSS